MSKFLHHNDNDYDDNNNAKAIAIPRAFSENSRAKKNCRVSFKDIFKGYNVILHFYVYFLYKISSLQKQLKLQTIFNLIHLHYSMKYMLHISCTLCFFFFPSICNGDSSLIIQSFHKFTSTSL